MRMKSLLCLSAILISTVFMLGLVNSATASPKRLLVTNAGNNTVSIIDIAKKEVINTIRVGVWPAGVAIDSSANRAYITNSSEGDSTVKEDCYGKGNLDARPIPSGKITNYYVNEGANF